MKMLKNQIITSNNQYFASKVDICVALVGVLLVTPHTLLFYPLATEKCGRHLGQVRYIFQCL